MNKYTACNKNISLEAWLRTFFVTDDGDVYLPCGAFGDESLAVLSLGFDGQSFVTDGGHAYAPATWLVKNYPHYAEAIKTIKAQTQRISKTGHRLPSNPKLENVPIRHHGSKTHKAK